MLARLDRFDRLIASSEARLIEQVFLIAAMEARGEDTATARRTLRAFEGILVEYRHARKLAEERRARAGEPGGAKPDDPG